MRTRNGVLYEFHGRSNVINYDDFVVETTNNMHRFVPLLYSIYWLLRVSAVACYHQGTSWVRLSYLKYRSKRW
jgi:hypothetical protein